MKWSQKPLALAAFAALAPLLLGATPATPLVHHFPVSGATTLALFLDGGNIHLIPESETSSAVAVTIVAAINSIAKPPQVRFANSGKNLNITFSGAPVASLPFVAQGTLAYEIRYPANMRLEIVDQFGDVTVDSPQAAVAIDDDSGNVIVNNAHARVDAVADKGNATVDLASGWNADAIRMESTQGDLRLTLGSAIKGELDASTEDGTVHNTAGDMIAKANLPVIFMITEKGDVWIAPHAAPKT
jgi:hypothetical protein